MESMPQALPVMLNKSAAEESVRDHELDKCFLASEGLLSSPFFKETEVTAENSEGNTNSYSESAASEDIGSMESDASSNALSEDSLVSDADSTAPTGYEEKHLRRCPSGGSIVTYDEAASKMREREECERADGNNVRRSKATRSNALYDEQETSINTGIRMTESVCPAWTDDKHCSYLNSIEATFVQSLYGQDYRVSGQDDQDCVESRPMYSNYSSFPAGSELFTSLQRGCYDQREYYRPHAFPNFSPSASAVLQSPWIQHFNPKTSAPSNGGCGSFHDSFAGHASNGASNGLFEGAHCSTFVNEGVKESVKEEVMESFSHPPPEVPQAPQSWSTRFQSQLHASSSAPRAETGIPVKKRLPNLDLCSGVVQRPKKHKSAQRSLVEMDLEMEEKFVLEQRNLKRQGLVSDLKEDGCLPRRENSERQLSQDQENMTISEDMLLILPQATWLTSSKDPINSRSVVLGRLHEGAETLTAAVEPHQCCTVILQPVEATFQDESLILEKMVEVTGKCGHLGVVPKVGQYEANHKFQSDQGLHKDEECEILHKRSPLVSRTFTWGSTGTRRLLPNECNVLVEPAAISGSAKGGREEDLQKKEEQY